MNENPQQHKNTNRDSLSAIRVRLHDILEAGHSDDRTSRLIDTFLVLLIVTNVTAFAVETVDWVAVSYGPQLELFNTISVLIFTIEYVLRLWVCVELPLLSNDPPWLARLKFARRPLLVIDLLAILPFYLAFLFGADLRILRVLRLLRFFKIARYSPALQTLGRVFANEKRALLGALIVMLSMLLFSSSIIYFIEREAQPEVFSSIPAAAWWALATLTTVGYGDIVPVTFLGRVFGGIVMIFGLGMFALPVGIIATGFGQEVNRREFVVTWSMIAKVPLFAKLDAASITKLVATLQSQSYSAGSVILREVDEVDAIYFLAAGEVRLEHLGEVETIQPGDFFGDATLDEKDSYEAVNATAISKCAVLELARGDFENLMKNNASLRDQIEEAINLRSKTQSTA